jgi:hypothetical protein
MGIGALFVPAITRLDGVAESKSAEKAGLGGAVAAPAGAQ